MHICDDIASYFYECGVQEGGKRRGRENNQGIGQWVSCVSLLTSSHPQPVFLHLGHRVGAQDSFLSFTLRL